MLKRLVLLMILIVVPFQMALAASAGYCLHEQGVAASHIGHHPHQHEDGGKFKGKIPGNVDDDCAYCHLGGAIVLPTVLSLTASPLPFVSSSSILVDMSSLPAREPERPKWPARA